MLRGGFLGGGVGLLLGLSRGGGCLGKLARFECTREARTIDFD